MNETPLCAAVYDQLLRAMASDTAGFIALYRDYLADAWQSLRIVKESIESGRTDLVRSNAHYLRSSSLVLGATDVARWVAKLEEAALASETKEFEGLLAKAQTALNEVQGELSVRLGAEVFPANQTAA